MKYKEYRQAFLDLKGDVIKEIKHQLIKENAAEIELHHGIIHNWIDDQQNEIIKRVNVETASVTIDTGHDSYNTELSELSIEEQLAILQEIGHGSYEIWEEFGS